MRAEPQRITWLSLLTSPQVVGSSAAQTSPCRKRGAIQYVIAKLAAMSVPEMLNVHCLCLEKLTSHGAVESREATVVPSPSKTNTDGSAQQMRVPNELKSEK